MGYGLSDLSPGKLGVLGCWDGIPRECQDFRAVGWVSKLIRISWESQGLAGNRVKNKSQVPGNPRVSQGFVGWGAKGVGEINIQFPADTKIIRGHEMSEDPNG